MDPKLMNGTFEVSENYLRQPEIDKSKFDLYDKNELRSSQAG